MFFIRFLFIVLLISCSSVYAAGPHGTQFGQPLSDTGQVLLTDEVAQALADTGAGFVRLNFRLGPYTSDTQEWYNIYDAIVNRLRSRGLEIIGLMTNEAWPGWWNATENAYETTGGNGYNAYLENWCSFFARAAARWQGQIKYWELWNEPDCLATIYPSNFGALLANAYDKVRTANIPVVIISGGVCTGENNPSQGAGFITNTYNVSINNTGWFSQMLAKWGTYPLDHIGYHIYIDQWSTLNTTKMSNLLDGVRNAYAAFEGANTAKKIWITEIGWATNNVTQSRQASNLTSCVNVANSKPYVQHLNWFFLQDVPSANLYYGVFTSGGFAEVNKKLAWSNMKTAFTYEGRLSAGGAINQPILNYFNTKGRAAMGNPYDNGGSAWVHDWDFGKVQDYDGGTLGRMIVFDAADGLAYCVRGNFFQEVLAQHPNVEFPLGEQFFTGIGEKQYFEGGYITWTPAGGAQTTLYSNKIILDNASAGFSASANWVSASAGDAWGGNYRRRAGASNDLDPAVWTMSVPQSGYYDVYARWPAYSTGMQAARYQIAHAGGQSIVTVNQSSAADRQARWNYLGKWQFNAGSTTIRLLSGGSSTQYLLADAVRMIGPVPAPDTTPPTVPVVTDGGQYTSVTTQLSASWESQDLESGIDRYEYAIGTTPSDPGSGYIVPWTSNGTSKSVTVNLTLTNGTTYYFYVRAYNNLGMVSTGISDGITVDTTPPTLPSVVDDGNFTGNPSMLHCKWSSSDPESGIASYTFGIGTSPYSANVRPLTNVGTTNEVWVSGLNLVNGRTYYFIVRAQNGAGFYSSYSSSNGITFYTSAQPNNIAELLGLPDSTRAHITNKVISAVFMDRFYIQETAFPRGIAVTSSTSLSEGSAVDISGTLQTISGERVLVPGCITPVQP